MGVISAKLRASAKGQDCTFQIVGVCNHDPETTVLCHIPDADKGMGNKANDFSAAFGCSNCHAAIDLHWLPKEEELFYQLRALQRTLKNWVERGLIVIPGDITKKRPAKKYKWPSRQIQSRPLQSKPKEPVHEGQ